MSNYSLILLYRRSTSFSLKLNNLLHSSRTLFLHEILPKMVNSKGIAIAFSIVFLWILSITYLLSSTIVNTYLPLTISAILLQTFLYTGLFITAHDAMHGSIFPKNPRVNHLIGSLAVFLYGFFSYQDLLKKHWRHHHHPATQYDPDYHDSKHANLLAWYLQFMKNYWNWFQLFCSITTFHVLHLFVHVLSLNLYLFWVLPSLLSSVQLFFFGTFLTHKEPIEGYHNSHRATTIAFPIWLSFITCYHFGYHIEHHQFPTVPWWQLPDVHRNECSEA